MTYSDDLQLSKTDAEQESQYPSAFGITFTPPVVGIIAGFIGVAAAGYMFLNMITPARQTVGQLEMDRDAKQAQLNSLKSGEITTKIQELEEKIATVKTLEPQILALFSDEKTLDTLLLDVNRFISANDAKLIVYEPESLEPTIINDNSLGELVNNKLKRKSIVVEMEGSYADIQGFLQDIEQLQPLLLIKDFNTIVTEKPTYVLNQGQITAQGKAKLKTSFRIDAILPLTPQEIAANQPPEATEEANAN